MQETNECSRLSHAQKKGLTDEIISDMGNIDYCLEYFVKLAESNKYARPTEIEANNRPIVHRASKISAMINVSRLNEIINDSESGS